MAGKEPVAISRAPESRRVSVACRRRSCPEAAPPAASDCGAVIAGLLQTLQRGIRPWKVGSEQRQPQSNGGPTRSRQDEHRGARDEERKTQEDACGARYLTHIPIDVGC